MPKRHHIFIAFFFQLVIQTACGQPIRDANVGPTQVVTDDLGRRVAVPQHLDRIISLAPNITEMLFALEVGDRLVGVTSYCNYPVEAQAKPQIGDTVHPSLERILALKPKVVVASRASQLQVFARQLEQTGIPLYVVDIHGLDDLSASLRRLGSLLDRKSQAEAVATKLEARLLEIERRSRGSTAPKVLLVIQRDPLMVPGTSSYLADFVRKAGGRLIGPDDVREGVTYSLESVIAEQPQFVIMPGGRGEPPHRLEPFVWDSLVGIPAIRQRNVFAIDADLLMRPGPRLLDGLAQLADILHPQGIES